MEGNPHRPCSIRNCAREAVEAESCEMEHWSVTIFYCNEHARELREGTPLGPVGVDPERVTIEPHGRKALIETPNPIQAIGPE